MSKKHHVIIGASAAGIGALSRLRTLDKESRITCISGQRQLPYNTCLLADYLAGEKELSQIATKPLSFFTQQNITLRLATTVTAIDGARKILQLCDTSGEHELAYDTLFLGLGTSLVYPSIPGIDTGGVFGFHTLSDTENIRSYMSQNNVRDVVVIGAGLSGVECADALAHRDTAITVVERESHLLPTLVDEEGAHYITQLMVEHNVAMRSSQSVSAIISDGGSVRAVELDDGTQLSADMVVLATGGRPNSQLAKDAGILLQDERVVVDEFQQTSIPGIYAGGDICLVQDMITKERVPSTLWTDAMMQGMHAAFAMTGKSRAYPGVCIVTGSRFFDTMFVSVGNINPVGQTYQEVVDSRSDFYHKFILKDGSLVGFVMVGKAKAVGALRALLVSGKTISADELRAL